MEGDVDAGGEVAEHLVAVEGDDLGAGVGEVVRQEAAAGAEGVAGPGDVEGDLLDADLEDVAGGGVGDGDGAGENVASRAFFGCGDVFVDLTDVRGDVGGLDAGGFKACGVATGVEGLDGDCVAGVDGEGGCGAAVVVAPDDGFGGGEEGLLGGHYGREGECGEGEQKWEAHAIDIPYAA